MGYTSLEYLSLYLGTDTPRCFSKLQTPAAISGTPRIPYSRLSEHPSLRLTRALRYPALVTSSISAFTMSTSSEVGMQEKQTIFLMLFGTWLFWFALFLSIGI